MAAAQPFRIAIPDRTLDDLRERLARTRWPDQIEGSGWDYGADTDYLRALANYWAKDFDWRAQEARLNAREHFRVAVDGFGLHVVRRRASRADAIPLLVLHGWPSSFVQMMGWLDHLDAAEKKHGVAFDAVVASLPGYGFSDIPAERGMSMARAGKFLSRMMREGLGFERFAIRASDVGAAIARQIALAEPERLIGLHISGTNPWLPPVLPKDLSAEEERFVADARTWLLREGAYGMMHASKPQTAAHALNDSPAGLAAWIVEKFRAWGDTGGDVESRFTKDDILTNLTVYWATGTINSSMRLYYEGVRDPGLAGRVAVASGLLMAPRDMFPMPRVWAERSYDVRSWRELPAGGHFLEWEEPAAVADDLARFFTELRQ